MQKEDIIDWQDLALSDYHLFGPVKECLSGKHYTCDTEAKTAVTKWLKVDFIISAEKIYYQNGCMYYYLNMY